MTMAKGIAAEEKSKFENISWFGEISVTMNIFIPMNRQILFV